MHVQISASEVFGKRKISRFFIIFVSISIALRNYFRHAEKTTSVTLFSVTFLNYTLVSSGNHIQNIQIVRAHTRNFTMAAAGRAFSPDRAEFMLHFLAVIF